MPPFNYEPEQITKEMNITEEMMREIFQCPKGYVVQRVGIHEAFEIQPNDKVQDLCDYDDWYTYAEFIEKYDCEKYLIVPIAHNVEEMTLEEVCKELGRTIKIVKG